MTIDRFFGEYRWLSNFWPVEVVLDGSVYPSVENAYQAAKTQDIPKRFRFTLCTSEEAKAFGKKLDIRADWDDVKIPIMRSLIQQKFQYDTELGYQLLTTEDEDLIEGNTWGDTFWGVCKGKGENWLGQLIMVQRTTLKQLRQYQQQQRQGT